MDSDEELMARVGAGSEPAFRELAARHVAPMLRLARRFLRNGADAEDVVQDALMRIWAQAPRWRPEAALRTWLYRVVVNLCIDRDRRVSPASLDDVPDPADPAPDPQARMEEIQTASAVTEALAELPARQRAAVTLTYYEGFSDAEAAAILATSAGSVESLLVRARRTLRDRLAHLRMR